MNGAHCVFSCLNPMAHRFITDFRKVNEITKTDSFPIPRIDDCIDNIKESKYVSKFDLMKGYFNQRSERILRIYHPRWCLSIENYAIWNENYTSNISENDAFYTT